MEAQEIFDTVAKHLFKQGCRSIKNDRNDPACLYRGPEGRMCAVGVLIPDELYDADMEYRNTYCLIWKEGSPLPGWMKANEPLLRRLQVTHDLPLYWTSSPAMRERLRIVALAHNLSADVLEGLAFEWDNKAEEQV